MKRRYGGYFHRDVPEEDAELTHVGPSTPGGEYLRRFWQPMCFSDDLGDLPLRVKMLGEEHLGATDRGVTMFRNQIRRGGRAVEAGQDPAGLCRDVGAVVPTYCNDTVVRLPRAGSSAMDKQQMRETGRRLARDYIEDLPLMTGR